MTSSTAPHLPDMQPKRRAADVAYDAIEAMISTPATAAGQPVVEANITDSTGLGRTPGARGALAHGVHRADRAAATPGLQVSNIDLATTWM